MVQRAKFAFKSCPYPCHLFFQRVFPQQQTGFFGGANKRNWYKVENSEELALRTPALSVVHTDHGPLHSLHHRARVVGSLGCALSSGLFCPRSPGGSTCRVGAASLVVPLITPHAVPTLQLQPRAPLPGRLHQEPRGNTCVVGPSKPCGFCRSRDTERERDVGEGS